MRKKPTKRKTANKSEPKVVLLFNTDSDYRRGILEGISKYSTLHGLRGIHLNPPSTVSEVFELVKTWKADGLIYEVPPCKDIENLNLLNIPVVAMGIPPLKSKRIHPIVPNHFDIGLTAGEYYFEKKFKNYAFCGYKGVFLGREISWSRKRFEGFSRVLEAKGFNVPIYENVFSKKVRQDKKELTRIGTWLKGLSRPVAVFACNDVRAGDVVEACRLVGLEVPDEVAVLGVDNDEFRCSLYNPPVSSVAMNTERAGYEAAELLKKMISGQEVDSNGIFIEPKYVVERQSTNILQVDDPDVRHALRYIHEHSNQILRIPDILEHVAVSRRTLELKFTQTLGHTIRDEIRKCHLQYISKLLIDTNIPILEIARSIGYTSEHNISRLFREAMGCTPREYRKKFGPKT